MQRIFPFVSIVIPVYNEEKYIGACLRSVEGLDYPENRFEIIVVDNGSTDSSLRIIETFNVGLFCIPDVNVGAVRNLGVLNASGSVIAFLDSDCTVDRDWLKLGVERILQRPNTVVGGNLRLRAEPFWVEKYWLLENKDYPSVPSDLLGSCIIIRRMHFELINGFEEGVTSGEDTDFSHKLKGCGLDVLIDPVVGVVHLGNPTNIWSFVKRQIWHSENYVRDFSKTVKDKTFYLVLFYIIFVIIFVATVFSERQGSYVSLACLTVPPIILSVKRILKSHYRPKSLFEILSIFILDNLYLCGRSIGLIKGIFH